MSYYVSVKNDLGTFHNFKVAREVQQYIKQLESAIKYPHASNIAELYPERFGKEPPCRVTVSAMAKRVGFSRSRFYQLIDIGFFPKPTRVKGGLPYYNNKGQAICERCHITGIGFNGAHRVFYTPSQEVLL